MTNGLIRLKNTIIKKSSRPDIIGKSFDKISLLNIFLIYKTMHRNVTKKKITRRRQTSAKNSLAIFNPWALLLVAIICILGFLIYFYSQTNSLTGLKNSFSKLYSWIDQHRHHNDSNMTSKSSLINQSEVKKIDKRNPIQFEFYSILPNMQLTLTDSANSREADTIRSPSSHDASLFSKGFQEDLEREISAHIQSPLRKSRKRE